LNKVTSIPIKKKESSIKIKMKELVKRLMYLDETTHKMVDVQEYTYHNTPRLYFVFRMQGARRPKQNDWQQTTRNIHAQNPSFLSSSGVCLDLSLKFYTPSHQKKSCYLGVLNKICL